MKKQTLLEIVLGTVGGLIFALGMCMCLIPEWDLLKAGIVVSVIGFLILLCIIPVYRSDKPKTVRKKINFSTVLSWIAGIVGTLIMGFGMSLVMVENISSDKMLYGIIIGIVGLIICILNYPIYAYLKRD